MGNFNHEMGEQEFDLIAEEVLQSKSDLAKRAAKLVLVYGRSNKEAEHQTGLSAQSVSNVLGRYRRKQEALHQVYQLRPES